jgi:hypothetical protein
MEKIFMTNQPLSRKSNIVVQNLENEVLIYDLTINKAFSLNETSGLVFALCDGTRTVAGISDEMSRQLKTPVSEDLVYLALEELRKNKLLENSDELTNHFAGMSRREVVKKVGLASMVVLPIIASVVAPSAAMAQSGSVCPAVNQCIQTGSEICGTCTRTLGLTFFDAGSNCITQNVTMGGGSATCANATLTAPFDVRVNSVT